MLLSLDDPILPFPFLMMCLESYSGNTSFQPFPLAEHPLMSPVKASGDILSQFPRTRIMIASNDPLRDESFRFSLNLM